MEEIAALREALLWAAGNETVHLSLPCEQYDLFLDAVERHRLFGRLVRRLQRETPNLTRALVDRVRKIQERIVAEARKTISLAERLGQAIRESGRDDHLILLKGFTLYALTGDPLTLRPMSDLDVNVSDLDGFVATAQRCGFEVVRPLNHLAEYAVLESDADGCVELHSRFDVNSLAPDVTEDDLDPRLHGGVWEQRRCFGARFIRHTDFQEYLGRSTVVADAVRPLGPEMAALVHAAHLFKNFLRYPHPLPIATVPLEELATFVDLCRLPTFAPARFAKLVQDFDGRKAVQFASALAADLLGASPLSDDGDRLFPVNMWWDGLDESGFPAYVGWDPAQLVYRDAPMTRFVEALGPTELAIAPGKACAFRLFTGDGDEASRYILRKDDDSRFVVDCAVSSCSSGLKVRICMPKVPSDRMVAIAVCFEDHRYEVILNWRGRDAFMNYSIRKDPERNVELKRSSSSADVVELTLPPLVVDSCATDGSVYGFLVIREQMREWSRMTAGAAVPLGIHLAEKS